MGRDERTVAEDLDTAEAEEFFPGEPNRVQTDDEAVEEIASRVVEGFQLIAELMGPPHVQDLSDSGRLTRLIYEGFVEAAEMVRLMASIQSNLAFRQSLDRIQPTRAAGYFARMRAEEQQTKES